MQLWYGPNQILYWSISLRVGWPGRIQPAPNWTGWWTRSFLFLNSNYTSGNGALFWTKKNVKENHQSIRLNDHYPVCRLHGSDSFWLKSKIVNPCQISETFLCSAQVPCKLDNLGNTRAVITRSQNRSWTNRINLSLLQLKKWSKLLLFWKKRESNHSVSVSCFWHAFQVNS